MPYNIKKLEWKEEKFWWKASVRLNEDIDIVFNVDKDVGGHSNCQVDINDTEYEVGGSDSVEKSKILCEEYFTNFMLEGLEEVEDG